MFAGLLVAIALLAEAAAPASAAPTAVPPPATSTPTTKGPAYGPPDPPKPPKPPEPKPPVNPADEQAKASDRCTPVAPTADTREIVVCAQKPQGYRLNPDVLEAKREMRSGGRPKRPDRMKDNSCATVGPAGCMDAPMINLIGAALTAAEMAARLSKGQEIGSMFITDPQPTEYQLYKEAKQRREAKEAEAKAAAAAKAKAAPQVQGKAAPQAQGKAAQPSGTAEQNGAKQSPP
ncbi:MAG: hypothetical protein ABI422_04970 [Sphingomicrobium sp.]